MITPADDLPLHQASVPIASPADGDPNRYDRYFFHGYDPASQLFFGCAMGIYPNRHIIDAAFAVGDGRVQRSVFASGRLPLDRRRTEIGPIRIEVVEPLRTLRVVVDSPEHEIDADLTFTARSVAHEEPRQVMRNRTRLIMDTTRLTQHGRWHGSLTSGREVLDLQQGIAGTRDRSWGVRPLAGATPEAPDTVLPAFFWLWAPIQLEDRCLLVGIMEDEHGIRSTSTGAVLHDVGDGPTWDAPERVRHARHVDYEIEWVTGTRRAAAARLQLDVPGEGTLDVELRPEVRFLLRGLGYQHPDWPHGAWHGEDAVGGEVLAVGELDPLDLPNIHVQQACQVTVGDEVGVGVLEQLHIGPHSPSGLPGFLDGAP